MTQPTERWSRTAIAALFDLPFTELLFRAASTHREHFKPNEVQLSQLLSIKTGACPEDCSYCPQSIRYNTGVEAQPLMPLDEVIAAATAAKAHGAQRFCMGAAWRSPKDKDISQVADMITAVKGLGMETCVTLGMLKPQQAQVLKEAGLDYYNHNIDTAPEHYAKVITTRTLEDRLNTLDHVRDAGIKVCCGGIVGMDEQVEDRVGFLHLLANMTPPPESVPINNLVAVPGTPLAKAAKIEGLDFVRVIAVARIAMPMSHVRLSAGRESMSDELQALCFMAGANSIFYGEKLLTSPNPIASRDHQLLSKLGMVAEGCSTY